MNSLFIAGGLFLVVVQLGLLWKVLVRLKEIKKAVPKMDPATICDSLESRFRKDCDSDGVMLVDALRAKIVRKRGRPKKSTNPSA